MHKAALKEAREQKTAAQRRRRAIKAGLIIVKQGRGFREYVDVRLVRKCEHCGEEFEPKRTIARFCCAKCRVYGSRKLARGRRAVKRRDPKAKHRGKEKPYVSPEVVAKWRPFLLPLLQDLVKELRKNIVYISMVCLCDLANKIERVLESCRESSTVLDHHAGKAERPGKEKSYVSPKVIAAWRPLLLPLLHALVKELRNKRSSVSLPHLCDLANKIERVIES
jgi:hypothetical protein